MAIVIKSFNQTLGEMVRTIIANTPLNDLNAGSVLLTLLEAAAANDFENNTAILNVLELLNIDAVQNNDLDARAGDYGLSRNVAIKASGSVTIFNTNITKRSTGLYVIKPAPISGQTVLFVNNTVNWAASGNLYIGRGTQNFEGPIAYTSITQFPTYSQINLASALQKDHLISDVVIDSQGEPDRIISAGTVVDIPANNQNPKIQYVTLRDAILPSGEDNIAGIQVIALVAGSQGNAGINTIITFDTPPFSGAGVSNTSALSDGADIETDIQLRNRIKSYAITLARGTAASIIAAVIGVSDPDDNKQVASAVITEPVTVGDPSILYIDDGSGFEPSFAGQSVDIMLKNATGKEEFLQLANYPVPRPQVINVEAGPFTVIDGATLGVIVDGIEETIQFTSTNFLNASAATISEIIIVINNQSTLFKARFADNGTHILIYPVDHSAEIIQVAPQKPTDATALYINNLLKFPTNEFSYISLFQNATRLHEKAKSASLETSTFATWNINATGDIIISVDNTPDQDRNFVLSDFAGASSFASLTLAQWVTVFNTKFAGLTAVATPNQTMIITSNKIGVASSISIDGGTYLDKWFTNGILTSVGQSSQFTLNRQTGNLQVPNIKVGDTISAGVEDAKGFDISSITTSGNYNVASDTSGRPSEMVVVADSTFCDQRSLNLLVGSTITITNPVNSVMRIMSATLAAFQSLLPGDFLYITARTAGWVNPANAGLFKIFAKGPNITAGTDSYIDVENIGVVPQSNVSILDVLDIKAFTTDGFPQIWRGSYVSNPPVAPITDIVNSLNTDLINVKASVYQSNSIKLTSTTEEGGSIAIPVAVSNAAILFTETAHAQFGNPPLIAHRVPDKDLISYFRRAEPVQSTWLGRHVYSDTKRALLANDVPDQPPYAGTYSEIVDANLDVTTAGYNDYLSFTRGDNRGQFRNIKAFPSAGFVGTQEGTARTILDHIIGDELEVIRPLQLSTDDSIVVVMDNDPSIETVDILLSRTGRVNSGSGGGTFAPTTTEFSANDADNEPSIDFSNTTVWGTVVNKTDFSDYAVWFRARNWYAGGGIGSGQGQFLIRSQQYGPNGENIRFALGYPTLANQAPITTFVNTPSFSTLTYSFGSGGARATAIASGTTLSVDGPYPDASTNFPNGTVSSGNYYDYTLSAGNFASVVVGDVISISNSGISGGNSGQFRVVAKSGNTIRVFNPNASVTAPGSPEITHVTTIADVVGTPATYNVITGASDLNLATAATYGILAKSAITNSVGTSIVNGDLGESPGSTVTGAFTVSGATNLANGAAGTAQTDANSAYVTFAAHAGYVTIANDLGTVGTLSAGYYTFAAGDVHLADSGPQTLTLNGSATDIFVFKTPSTLTTGAGGMPTITLTGGVLASNVYWVVGSAASINVGVSSAGGVFQGTILAATAITVTQGGTVNGRLITTTASGTAITLSQVTTINAPSGTVGSLNLKYFIIYDAQGSVAVWYDVNNTGEPAPITGANRNIKVASVVTGDSASTIATKTGQTIALDNAFSVGVIGDQVAITNIINGAFTAGTSSTSGFTVTTTSGTPNNTLNGKYFIIHDQAGSVAVWFDMGNGSTPEPFHGADRSIKVSGANFGDSASTIASAIVAAINGDSAFSASSVGTAVTITASIDGNLPNSIPGTSGLTITSTNGTLTTAESITNPSGLAIFPLTGNDVATIVSIVNAGTILELVAVGNPAFTIDNATAQEDYTYDPTNALDLAYGHNPTDPTTRGTISLYDSVGYCKTFENSNPNFILKSPLLLNGVSTVYSMDTAPNGDSPDVGEFFKLIPTSIKNVYHHLTQKALSQLPIIANIDISNDRKRVQIDSKLLGSAGAIEVIGGNGNKSQAYILAEAEDVTDSNGNSLLIKIPAFPDTFNKGDFVEIQNDAGVKRLSRLQSGDTIDVTQPSAGLIEYNFNPKVINVGPTTTFTITDVSGSYSRPAGFVWRWTHSMGGGATLAAVNAGDIVFAFGTTLPWAQGNKVQASGDNHIAGFPIIFVNDGSNYFDIVNPLGKAMSSTAIGSGNTVQICPTPAVRWTLNHAAKLSAVSMVGSGTVVSVITGTPHRLNTGDSIDLIDSANVPDGSYGPVTVTSSTTFTFAFVSSSFSETADGASLIGSGITPTRYRIEKLGFNSMVRLSRQDGSSPRFADCGVAVDDYITLGGSTFKANNNGMFRVAALDNDSIIFINSQASDELNTTNNFNNKSLQATWTANTNFVTGLAGTFKDVSVGDWVKKPEDPDSFYLQVTSMTPSTPYLTTQINLGGSYSGATAVAPGVTYDELNDYDKGIFLQGVDDIVIFEGDVVVAGDFLSVQNIIDPNWFSVNNIGTFEIAAFGTNGITYKPFVRVPNSSGISETARQISIAPAGFYITESFVNKFHSIRQISYAVIDDLSVNNRAIYMTPDDRSYKFSNANNTSITHIGKLGYNTDITTGIDGYLYYTGLLRRVQRIVDGFEPDAVNYPGRRAVGGLIETLPPLVRRIAIAITVTTNNGVNLGDISNNIKSVIINYVQGLGVGQDVIISAISAQVMNIKGVAAVTFTSPIPSTERITIATNERANIVPEDIGIA